VPSPDAAKPRVVVFGLGGTIAMTSPDGQAVTPTLSADSLLAAVPGLADLDATLDPTTFRSRPGASLTFADLTDLAAAIRAQLEAGAGGVVVTQGTDTIEETAFLLDLLHHRDEPVVVTGAMRNPTQAGADGPANLLAAIRVAADDACRGQGALVVFNDEIHAAGRVRKTHSSSTATFQSPNGGPIGYVVEGIPRLLSPVVHRHTVNTTTDSTPRVGLLVATLGDDHRSVPTPDGGLNGLVVAGFGVGHVPDSWVAPLTALAAAIPVVLCSRTGGGPVLSHTYGFPGSEQDLQSRGLLGAGFLDPYKARILLHLCLTAAADTDMIAAAFRAAGGLGDPDEWPWPTGAVAASGAAHA
jgi:L-asparaginase